MRANLTMRFLMASGALVTSIQACAGSTPGEHSTTTQAIASDGGCVWPAAATAVSGCEPDTNTTPGAACPASSYSMLCRNTVPQASLGCWVPLIPGQGPSVVRYCCPCGQ